MWIVTVVGGPIESGPAAGTLSPGQEFSSWLPAQARGKKGGDWPGSPLRLTGGQEKEGGCCGVCLLLLRMLGKDPLVALRAG